MLKLLHLMSRVSENYGKTGLNFFQFQLEREEEELRREEEAYYEAKQEAARIAELQRAKEKQARLSNPSNGPKNWTPGDDSDWEV